MKNWSWEPPLPFSAHIPTDELLPIDPDFLDSQLLEGEKLTGTRILDGIQDVRASVVRIKEDPIALELERIPKGVSEAELFSIFERSTNFQYVIQLYLRNWEWILYNRKNKKEMLRFIEKSLVQVPPMETHVIRHTGNNYHQEWFSPSYVQILIYIQEFYSALAD